MGKYGKMFAVGTAAALLTGGVCLLPGTSGYAAENDTVTCELAMESQNVSPGDTFTVNVNLTGNPGTVFEDGILTYDTGVLELTTYKATANTTAYDVYSMDLFNIAGYMDSAIHLFESPIPHDGQVRMLDGYATYEKNSTSTGTMFTLTFQVKEDAAIGAKGTFTYEGTFYGYLSQTETSVYDAVCEPLTFQVVCAHKNTTEKVIKESAVGITGEKQILCSDCGEVVETQEIPAVKPILYGDVNDDGKINVMDSALILRSLAGWSVTMNEQAADVDLNGKIDIADSAVICRYLVGWSVTLGM